MQQPSSRYLSHDYPAFKGLSLRELFMISLISTISTALLFTLIGGWLFGFYVASFCIGFLSGFILAVTLWPKIIAKQKAGKPHGYLRKRLMLWMVQLKLKHSPWLFYQGIWRKSRSLGESHD